MTPPHDREVVCCICHQPLPPSPIELNKVRTLYLGRDAHKACAERKYAQ